MRVLALLAFTAIAYSQTESRLAEQEVKGLEELWCKAWVAADAATLDRIHADDYVAVNNIGTLNPKSSVIADVRAGLFRYQSMEHRDLSFRVYGDTVVVVGVTVNKGNRGERDVSGTFRYTRVWVKRRGIWQVVLSQYTRIV
jgi:ketosteroid isomerase-like protein